MLAFDAKLSVRLGKKGEQSMSWIDDEAEKDRSQVTSAKHQRETIQRSNAYASIISQIQNDVAEINGHPHWKLRLAGFPLRFEQLVDSEGGYAISKLNSPGVTILVRNKGDHLIIQRRFIDNGSVSAKYRESEKLNVATKGGDTCLLTAHEDVLGVPEQAAKFILEPIIESLKMTPFGSADNRS